MIHVSVQLYLIVFKQIRNLALWGLFHMELSVRCICMAEMVLCNRETVERYRAT